MDISLRNEWSFVRESVDGGVWHIRAIECNPDGIPLCGLAGIFPFAIAEVDNSQEKIHLACFMRAKAWGILRTERARSLRFSFHIDGIGSSDFHEMQSVLNSAKRTVSLSFPLCNPKGLPDVYRDITINVADGSVVVEDLPTLDNDPDENAMRVRLGSKRVTFA